MARRGGEYGGFGLSGKEIKRIQKQAAAQAEQQRQERERARQEFNEKRRSMPNVETTRISRSNPEADIMRRLDRRGVFGNYYTGNEQFDRKIAGPLNDSRPQYGSFVEQYDKQTILSDKKKVESIKQSAQYQHERSSEPVSLEYSLAHAAQRGLFGEKATATLTTEYDDVVHGIDMVVSFPENEQGERFALGLDVTTTSDVQVISHKLGRTADTLQQKKLSEVKYYADPQHAEVRGQLVVPRVVIGIESQEAQQIQNDLAGNPDSALSPEVRAQVLEETELQLVQELQFLLSRFYGPSAERIGDAETALAYWEAHADRIAQEDADLGVSARRIVEPLRNVHELRTKNNPSELDASQAGVVLSTLRQNRF